LSGDGELLNNAVMLNTPGISTLLHSSFLIIDCSRGKAKQLRFLRNGSCKRFGPSIGPCGSLRHLNSLSIKLRVLKPHKKDDV
jgi:hypothetical protein